MLNKKLRTVSILIVIALFPLRALATDIYSVQLFFGLSIPDGGVVSVQQWDNFVVSHIVKRFDGFNIVDSTGYWKGKLEHAKIVTIIAEADKVSDAQAIAHDYAKMFHQDSVMLIQSPITNWEFITK